MKTLEFFKWMVDRHEIFLKKEEGRPKPWTQDKIFLENKFCNPFRENDKTTVWFRENIREPLRDNDSVMLATTIFRWFNFIPTGEILLKHNLYENWNPDTARKLLSKQKKIITGAYIIKTPDGSNKLDGIIWCINNIKQNEEKILNFIKKSKSLQKSTSYLTQYPYLGNFMAYEITTDLRHTKLLENADDINLWANPGPGAQRGLNRIHERPIAFTQSPHKFVGEMQDLLRVSRQYLPFYFPSIEMRDIEHSLCEFDKYQRIKSGDGRMKNKYNGYPENTSSLESFL